MRDIEEAAMKAYPDSKEKQMAYLRGYKDAVFYALKVLAGMDDDEEDDDELASTRQPAKAPFQDEICQTVITNTNTMKQSTNRPSLKKNIQE